MDLRKSTAASDRLKPFPLRMPMDLRSWFEREAEENCRSLNKELVKVLTEKMNRSRGARK